MGRRNSQRSPEPGDWLALARRGGRGQRGIGELRQRRRRTRHARHGAPAVQPAWRQGRRGHRQAVRARCRNRNPRRPAPLQATRRSGRSADDVGSASRMKALCWYGTNDVRVARVPDPRILNPRDAIVKVPLTAICGSDLHLLDGFIPTMKRGDILGHEFMGEVVEVGPENKKLRVGDRVVVPFTIACGRCFFCEEDLWSLCDNSNPNAWMAEALYGYSPSGLFGYSHMLGGYAGGPAEYARVPVADVGPLKVPAGVPDEQVLFLSDIFPTAYQAAEQGNIQPGDVV